MVYSPTKVPPAETLISVPQCIGPYELAHKIASRIAKLFRTTAAYINVVYHNVPAKLMSCIKVTKVLNGLNVVTNLPSFVNNAYAAFKTSSPSMRIERIWQTLTAGAEVIEGFADTVEGLRAVRIIPKALLPWTGLVDPILFPIGMIGFMRGTYKFAETHEFYNEMKDSFKPLPSKADANDQIAKTCNFIITNERRITKSLDFDQDAKIAQRARTILNGLTADKEEAAKRTDELTKVLRGRVNTKLGLDVSTMALKAVEIASAAFLIGFGASPVGLGVMGAAIALSLIPLGISTFGLSGNPFDKTPSPIDVIAKKATSFVQSLPKMIGTTWNRVAFPIAVSVN